MTSYATQQSTEVGCVDEHDSLRDGNRSPNRLEEVDIDEEDDEEEDEEEDVDFNPFLKESPSPEASSSLSSEVVGGPEHVEDESANQTAISHEEACEREKVCEKDGLKETKKRKSVSLCESEVETVQVKDNAPTSSGVNVNDGRVGELSKQSWKPKMDSDEEDAICRRTRARYSLAGITLDELEAFLQETDDDDDLQNVDDEEEYRKFLAAVLQGGDVDGQSNQVNADIDIDDDDEDNDADFEIELEEMLESDYEEGTTVTAPREEIAKARRRPETRQNRRQKVCTQYKMKHLEQAQRPLRPLVPVLPSGQPIAPFPTLDGNILRPETAPNIASSATKGALINGFAPHQIGQLHCLIHEHMQLLIQVFSLCILDPSRQQIASEVQGLISEMLHKRNELIACKSKPYPDTCFRPPFICSSVMTQSTAESSPAAEAPGISSPSNIQVPDSANISLSEKRTGDVPNSHVGSSQTAKCSFWTPLISGSVWSVLDVAPLNLVGRYMEDVHAAVQEYRQHSMEFSSDVQSGREPLFPFSCFPSAVEANMEVCEERTLTLTSTPQSPPSQQPPKKSLAAALVESTKKQPVALVPKEISKLSLRFMPLFNPSLFPHKPPPTAVANRVLFTDAEDELLALGIMEYNTDWKAIQQRFLPCKSKHQIFVRQKNRCSSKAPENPIKAVRRMKTSPLNAEEIDRIQEGLKVFKLDWMSVWKFMVPHRDPTLLRRQWRIALGTQKSYKQDAAKRERRRMYELKRRCRTADLAHWHLNSDKEGNNATEENNSGDAYVDNADEGNVDEAGSRMGASNPSSDCPGLKVIKNHHSNCTVPQQSTQTGEKPSDNVPREPQAPNISMPELPSELKDSPQPHSSSHFTNVIPVSNAKQPNIPVSSNASKTSRSQVCLPPYQARRNNNAHWVRLAPNLPPVNLPPSVRVISQSAFRSDLFKAPTSGGFGDSIQENVVPPVSNFSKWQTPCSAKDGRDQQNAVKETGNDKSVEEDRGAESDLHLHPLLFQAPEDGHLPYYPSNSSTAFSSSFSFFSGNQPQLNLSLFHNPHQVNHYVDSLNKSLKTKESISASCSIDFHPLLIRNEDTNGLEGRSDPRQNRSDAMQNSVDLEMHLSSTSTKEKAVGGADMTAHSPMWSTIVVADSRDAMGTQNINSEYYQCGTNPNKLISGVSSIDHLRDNSLPGIVMEQEELSDSDEEIEEHVEFECEEMADSEGEDGSGCNQLGEMQDKELPRAATEAAGADGDRDDDQPHESRTHKTKATSWLSLNSGSPSRLMPVKPTNQEDTYNEGLPGGDNNSCRPNRSCKKTTAPPPKSKKVAAVKQTLDMTQQLGLGPSAARAARKPRKRGSRADTGLTDPENTGSPSL